MNARLNGTGRDCDPAFSGASCNDDAMKNHGWYQKSRNYPPSIVKFSIKTPTFAAR